MSLLLMNSGGVYGLFLDKNNEDFCLIKGVSENFAILKMTVKQISWASSFKQLYQVELLGGTEHL